MWWTRESQQSFHIYNTLSTLPPFSGAIGCGAFRNPPDIIAHLFMEAFESFYPGTKIPRKYFFDVIAFAVLDGGQNGNHVIFSDIADISGHKEVLAHGAFNGIDAKAIARGDVWGQVLREKHGEEQLREEMMNDGASVFGVAGESEKPFGLWGSQEDY